VAVTDSSASIGPMFRYFKKGVSSDGFAPVQVAEKATGQKKKYKEFSHIDGNVFEIFLRYSKKDLPKNSRSSHKGIKNRLVKY